MVFSVEIRDWWAGDTDERFWLEVTDRDNLGADLFASKTTVAGHETPSHSMVAEVSVGDVVVHWWMQAGVESAAVAYSKVVGPVEHAAIRRKARAAWRAPLGDFTELDVPVTLADLRQVETELRVVRGQLRITHGNPLYLPFAFSNKRPLRPAQGYLFKLPKAMLEAIPGLHAVTGQADLHS